MEHTAFVVDLFVISLSTCLWMKRSRMCVRGPVCVCVFLSRCLSVAMTLCLYVCVCLSASLFCECQKAGFVCGCVCLCLCLCLRERVCVFSRERVCVFCVHVCQCILMFCVCVCVKERGYRWFACMFVIVSRCWIRTSPIFLHTTATHCNSLQHTAMHCNPTQAVITSCYLKFSFENHRFFCATKNSHSTLNETH